MKVFISADLEGITAVVHEEHVRRDGREHDRARKLMTQEVNAAIEGALEAGATEIIVNDSHATMRNIIPEELHEAADLITGSPKPLSMMEGIGNSFDAAFLVGYHANPSSFPSIMGHTYDGRIYNLKVNKKIMSEVGINAAVAGYYNVPVALVTGDTTVTTEAVELLGKVEIVAVKKAVGRNAAQCLALNKARKLIKEAAHKSLGKVNDLRPYKLEPPTTFEIDFINAGMIEMPMLIPGVKQITSRTVAYTSNDFIEAFKAFRAIIALAGPNV